MTVAWMNLNLHSDDLVSCGIGTHFANPILRELMRAEIEKLVARSIFLRIKLSSCADGRARITKVAE